MKIITSPDPILLEKAKAVVTFDRKLKQFVHLMNRILDETRDPVGVGLAAPQVGASERIFLAKPDEHTLTKVYINPEIIDESKETEIPEFSNNPKVEAKKPKKSKGKLLEGCLSLPNIWGNVSRKKEVTVKYQDLEGIEHTEKLSGFEAIIVQHELDHLNGILFTTHVIKQGEQLYRSHNNKKGEDEFEEINV